MSRDFRDEERMHRVSAAMAAAGLDALVCGLPPNVLMLSGYWPVIGNALAIATREGLVAVVAPEDEQELASGSWADTLRLFTAGSLDSLAPPSRAVCQTLRDLRQTMGFHSGTKVGFEGAPSFDPAGYVSTFLYGAGMEGLLASAFPSMECIDATGCLARLRSVLTTRELERVRRACALAREAFSTTAAAISAGMPEFEIAALLRSKLVNGAAGNDRCDGAAYCMSGPNSAQAYAAFQQSRSRTIARGDFVLLHCNSYCGGFWTDITRTFSIAPESTAITSAVLEASRQARDTVRPGIKASQVDHAARAALESRGFGKEFKHATGHGVGFAAINHDALPRIHPLSDEILDVGMVFNIEPAVYIPEVGGMRHCDMVAVTADGAELLTPFQSVMEQLVLP